MTNKPKLIPALGRLDAKPAKLTKQARLRRHRQVKAWQRKRQAKR
jgi:hypothetical protein